MKTRLRARNNFCLKEGGYFSLLGILISAAIAALLLFYFLKSYSAQPALFGEINKTTGMSGIDASDYRGVLDTTKARLKSASESGRVRLEEIEKNR